MDVWMLNKSKQHQGRTLLRVLVFFASFVALLVVVTYYYLLPAYQAFLDSPPSQRQRIGAASLIVLTVVLFVFFVGIMWGIGVRRFLVRQRGEKPSPTQYIDAWQEAGKRMKLPDEDESES